MLKIFNRFKKFFEDCYRQINVREYARLQKMTPPTASKLLGYYHKEDLLKKRIERRYFFYRANKENKVFIDLSRIYWRVLLEKSGLIEYLNCELNYPTIILFGSLSKAENRKESDIDIVIFSDNKKKKIFLEKFEKKIKRKIQVFRFSLLRDIKNEDLRNNILNGYILSGKLK